jgi:prepilin-type N-terminal cleavage/methylation domain-containing protein
MIFKKQKGFTIIELIVVIAIIAALAAIVVTSTQKYIARSKNAAIEANLNGLITLGTKYFSDNNTYQNFCSNNFSPGKPIYVATKTSTLAHAPDDHGVYSDWDNKVCADTHTDGDGDTVYTEWAACAQFWPQSGGSSTYWCVDSKGAKRQCTGVCMSYYSSLWNCTDCATCSSCY